MENKEISFVCCWTCKHCVYDMAIMGHKCSLDNAQLARVHHPTKCNHWKQD